LKIRNKPALTGMLLLEMLQSHKTARLQGCESLSERDWT